MIGALSFTVTEVIPAREAVKRDSFVDAVEEPHDGSRLVEPPVPELGLPQSGPLTDLRPRVAP